jgi:hypothetical protein
MAVAYIMLTFIWKKEQEGEKETLVKKIVELESKIG